MNQNKNIILKKKCKYFYIILIIFLFIKIFISELKDKKNSIKNKLKVYSLYITYKGKKILKDKLFENYLSKVSNDYKIAKERERKRLSRYYNLSDYSNDLIVQSYLRKKLYEEISKLRNQTITKLDAFFLSTNFNFGNNLIIVNNVIFYCEILGCHKIILNQYNLHRRWLIINTINIKTLNITNYASNKD